MSMTPEQFERIMFAAVDRLADRLETISQSRKTRAERAVDPKNQPDATTQRGDWCKYLLSFGKYIGKRLDEVPRGYLDYFSEEHQKGNIKLPDLKAAIGEYRVCRAKQKPEPQTT
jgi:hypothetical protein